MKNLTAPGVYKITNTVNGHCYVGSAVNIANRWKAHRHSLTNNRKPPPKLKRAWDKHGVGAFTFAVLEYCEKHETLAREQFWIDVLKPAYNTRKEAYSNIGLKWSDETNAKKARKDTAQYTIRGVTGSLKQLATHFGVVSDKLARHRIDRGMSVEEALTTARVGQQEMGRRAAATHKRNGTHPAARMTRYSGVTAPLNKIIEKFSDHPLSRVKARLARGWPLGKALSTPYMEYADRKQAPPKGAAHYKAKVITVRGFTGIVSDVVKRFGVVNVTTVLRRLRHGWAPEEAVLTPNRAGKAAPKRGAAHPRSKLFTIGPETGTLEDFAQKLGVPKNTLAWRLRNGWAVEKALTTPQLRKGRNQWMESDEGR